MTDETPVTGEPVINAVIRVLGWLDEQIGQFTPRTRPQATEMTGEQLHHAIHDAGANLLSTLGPVLQQSFARYGTALSDRRFPYGMPTTVRGHVLTMVTEATDSYRLSLLGVRGYGTAAALGPIRAIAETFAQARWLLESPRDEVRNARAYHLTLNAVKQIREVSKTAMRAVPHGGQTPEIIQSLSAAQKRMRRSLTAIAREDGITIPGKPGSASKLIEDYLPDYGGYMLCALLSSAGVHPGPARGYLFCGQPGTGTADYDFKGMNHAGAYWTAKSTSLLLGLCGLVAPVLGWQDWDTTAATIEGRLQPLAEEAERRFSQAMLQNMIKRGK